MTIELRDYQQECMETVLSEFKAGVCCQLISLPTGSGKTVVMGAITRKLNKRTLLLAHREELINQAVEKFRLVWPEVSISVCMGELDEIEGQVVVGSIQSCSRPKRLERLKEQGFEVLMIDEAHHSVSDSYQAVISALGFGTGNAGKLLLGVTATVERGDGQQLGETFDKITFSRSIGTMIKAGYLASVVGRKILTNFILERIRTQNGDFSISDLSEAVNTPERNLFIVDRFKTYAYGRKAICFCVDVQHCKDIAEAFNREGISAEAVWGDMEADHRKRVLDDLKTGKIQIASSCGVLIEGFDEPTISAIVMARPTKSRALYVQSVGRGLRLHPSKSDCLVLDFTDKSHNLDSVMSLTNVVPEAAFISDVKNEVEEREDRSSKIEVFEEVDREFDILGRARFMWVAVGDEWSLLDDERNEIVMSQVPGGYKAVLYQPNGLSSEIVSSPLPLEYCSGVCEDFARRNLKVAFSDLNAVWLRSVAPPTQGQRDYLEKQGEWREEITKGEAAFAIRSIVATKNKERRMLAEEPITGKQKYFLRGCGVDTTNMSKLQAMQAISKLKQKVG